MLSGREPGKVRISYQARGAKCTGIGWYLWDASLRSRSILCGRCGQGCTDRAAISMRKLGAGAAWCLFRKRTGRGGPWSGVLNLSFQAEPGTWTADYNAPHTSPAPVATAAPHMTSPSEPRRERAMFHVSLRLQRQEFRINMPHSLGPSVVASSLRTKRSLQLNRRRRRCP